MKLTTLNEQVYNQFIIRDYNISLSIIRWGKIYNFVIELSGVGWYVL